MWVIYTHLHGSRLDACANVDLAIPKKGHNRKRMEIVKESFNEGYCGTSG